MPVIMEGRSLAKKIKQKVAEDVKKISQEGITIGLGLLLVGENSASEQYLRATVKACKETGIVPYEFRFPEDVSMNEVLNVIHSCNNDERIHGVLVFFPLPKKLNARKIVNSILPEKDVDGLGSVAIGKFAAEESTFQLYMEGFDPSLARQFGFLPCTPFGVIRLLEHYQIPVEGRHAVVIGKSLAVGKPLSLMLLAKEATVTVCHKKTANLKEITKQADILCVAAGRPNLITEDMVKEGAVVVDIGISVMPDERVVGDVDFPNVSKKAYYITPVPGGVGPVTIAMLLENTVKSAMARL